MHSTVQFGQGYRLKVVGFVGLGLAVLAGVVVVIRFVTSHQNFQNSYYGYDADQLDRLFAMSIWRTELCGNGLALLLCLACVLLSLALVGLGQVLERMQEKP